MVNISQQNSVCKLSVYHLRTKRLVAHPIRVIIEALSLELRRTFDATSLADVSIWTLGSVSKDVPKHIHAISQAFREEAKKTAPI